MKSIKENIWNEVQKNKNTFSCRGFFSISFSHYIKSFFMLKLSIISLENEKYGVIDENITKIGENIVYKDDQIIDEENKTHGDNMTNFISCLHPPLRCSSTTRMITNNLVFCWGNIIPCIIIHKRNVRNCFYFFDDLLI